MKHKYIFSGDYSRDMWYAINHAKSTRELRDALYFVCCRIQELETIISKLRADGALVCKCERPHHSASHPEICMSCGAPRR